jgi:DNA-binding FadR family transcriptional regulator
MSIIMRMHEDRRAPQSEGNWRLGDHSRLIEAVCEGAPERAVKEIRFHLTENFKTTRERLRAFLEGEADEAIGESVLENE